MGRLDQHRKKQLKTTIVFTILIFITAVVFIFTLGFKLLLNASVFIAQLSQSRSKQPSLVKNQNFIGNIDIDDIATATNSSKIMVSGSVVNFNQLEFYINDTLVKQTDLPDSDTFSEQIGNLNKGPNEIYVIAKSKNQNEEKKSKVFQITYKSDMPKLDISQPQDNSTTNQQEITISGSTDKDTYIKINDIPIVVDAKGNFQTTVRLKDGDNKISAQAEDIAGNIVTKSLTVTYHKGD